MPNENTTLVQTQLRQEKPPIASGKLNMTAKRNRGKELKGPPFISKPEVILFKDFDVGKMYKKKIVLTNISYAVINCKFLGVSPHLKNFFTINQFIDFGSHVVGQTISRTITLTNKGALATHFSLDSSTCLSPETSYVQMPPQVSTNTYEVRGGEIGSFESVKLEIIFTPTIPGETRLDFSFKFSDKTSKPIPIHVRGVAVSMPVWVLQPNIDLKICMFDRLYQDTIIVQTSTALKLTFEVCQDMRKHMEILPKTGFIQAQSSFSAQLKFIPRRSLSKDAKFFDSDTGVLEVPMTVQVAGQVQPAHFTVHAIVTSSDLQFDHSEVDFGYCSIYQSVKSSIRLTNLSLLPQDFGFLGVPEFIEVQPNDGFGTLLPQETLEVDLIFSAQTAKEYVFQLSCKSGINRDFLLSCRAVGVHPPLELSHFLVQFGATAVGDQSTAMLFLSNRQTGRDQNRQPVSPGVKAPVMPRLFSFALPEDSDIDISPSAGRLLPGEVRYLNKLQGFLREFRLCSRINKGIPTIDFKVCWNCTKKVLATRSLFICLIVTLFLLRSSWYEEAKASLLYSFRKRYREYTIPCFVSDGDPPEDDKLVQPAWSPFNTLYLKLQCPAVQPPLVVISNNGCNIINFHQVTVGERVIKRFTVQNISQESLDVSFLFLFVFYKTINYLVRCQKMTLEMTLLGEGIVPAVTSSHNGDVLDFGYVLEKETASQVVKVCEIQFFHTDLATCFLACAGTQNYSGLSVFSVVPVEGSIPPGQSQEFTVTFQPDHPSVNYSDKLTIELMNKSKVCVMELKGAASSHSMYLCGGDPLTVPVESLLPPVITSEPQLTGGMIQFHCFLSNIHFCFYQGGEFYWDNVASLQQQGFNVEPSKGNVDTGQRRAIRITWTPHTGYNMCVPLTLKGDRMNVYRVTLMALVSTTAD
uniref:Abnormal spindle-like microcephaly-associated protein ASH domain-containing protein n=1 Tax=Astatotilapia calliptera TaxID=8154 RepID=A0A3P8Q830_ASTCA